MKSILRRGPAAGIDKCQSSFIRRRRLRLQRVRMPTLFIVTSAS
jgi:hypothetical protein